MTQISLNRWSNSALKAYRRRELLHDNLKLETDAVTRAVIHTEIGEIERTILADDYRLGLLESGLGDWMASERIDVTSLRNLGVDPVTCRIIGDELSEVLADAQLGGITQVSIDEQVLALSGDPSFGSILDVISQRKIELAESRATMLSTNVGRVWLRSDRRCRELQADISSTPLIRRIVASSFRDWMSSAKGVSVHGLVQVGIPELVFRQAGVVGNRSFREVAEDVAQNIPDSLPAEFTVDDLAAVVNVSPGTASKVVRLLVAEGIFEAAHRGVWRLTS